MGIGSRVPRLHGWPDPTVLRRDRAPGLKAWHLSGTAHQGAGARLRRGPGAALTAPPKQTCALQSGNGPQEFVSWCCLRRGENQGVKTKIKKNGET